METNKEIWKPVYLQEYKHLYEVSNKGKVRKGNFVTEGTLVKKGYKRIVLRNGKTERNIGVHRLVMFTFDPVENPEIYDVHHRDKIKDNNKLNNLQRLTKKEHIDLERRLGNNKVGLYGKKSLMFKGLVGKFNFEGYLISVYEGAYDLRTSGYDSARVYHVINKIRKSHRGFIWKRFPKKHKPEIGKQYDLNDTMFDRVIRKLKVSNKREHQLAFKF